MQGLLWHNQSFCAGASPNVSWIVPSPLSPSEGGGEGAEEDDDGGGEGSDDGGDEREDVSCIGVRKVCLQSPGCNQSLNDFRTHCHENRKTSECVAADS